MDTQQKIQPNSKMPKPEKLPVTKRCQVILKCIPEEPENKQKQGSNNADKSEQNFTICEENDKIPKMTPSQENH